ncbi:cation:proton antiporter [Gordonia sinesedis]
MTGHQVAFLLLDVAVVIAAARIGGRIARAVRQPPVVGEIAAGIALGPSLLGLFPGDPSGWLFPDDVRPLLGALAQIGLVLFMFIVGLELDMRLIRGRERAAATISISSILVPFALGAGLAVILYPTHDMVGGLRIGLLPLALFLGIAMSITAFPVLARILSDRGMQRTVPGVFSLAAAAIDDILAWTLLAFVIAVIGGGSPLAVARIVGLTLVYVAVMLLVVRPLLRRLVDRHAQAGRLTPDLLAVVLIGLFASAALTDVIGIHQIFGAFVFGAMMPKVGAETLNREILERLEQASVLLLLPMFFVVTGLSVNLTSLGPSGWWQLLLVLAVAIGGKFVGAFAGARLSRIPTRQAGAIAVLMNTRGLTELVILSAGRELGVLSDDLFAMLVVMALATTVLTEPLLRLVYPDRVVANDIAAAERLAATAGSARRVMLVVGDPSAPPDVLRARHPRLLATAAGHDVVLAGLLPTPAPTDRLEIGASAVPDFAAMATAVEGLTALGASLGEARSVSVLCRFGAEPIADLDAMAANSTADLIVVDASDIDVARGLRAAPVLVVDETRIGSRTAPHPAGVAPSAELVCVGTDSRSGRTAIVIAAGLALTGGTGLRVLTGGSRRRLLADLAPVSSRGVAVAVSAPDVAIPLGDTVIRADDAPGPTGRAVDYLVIDATETSEDALGERVVQWYGRTEPEPVPSLRDDPSDAPKMPRTATSVRTADHPSAESPSPTHPSAERQ